MSTENIVSRAVSNLSHLNAELDRTKSQRVDVETFDDFESCAGLRDEWDFFVESLDGEIFLSFDWCRVWWKHYGEGRKLMIFVFRSQGRIVGLLPVMSERLWLGPLYVDAVRLIGTDFTPVALSVTVYPEYLTEVVEQFRKNLEERCKWDVIYIGALAGVYAGLPELQRSCEAVFGDGYTTNVKEEGSQIYFHLKDSWEDHLRSLTQKQRTNARRAQRDVAARGLDLSSSVCDQSSWKDAFEEFVALHQKYWQGLCKPGHFGAWPGSLPFHREVAETQMKLDRLRLLQIAFNGTNVDYEYIYRLGKRYFWFLNGRSNHLYKSGLDFKWIALKAKIEQALAEEVTCIDSMRGDYDYKVYMGGVSLPIRSLIIAPSRGLKAARVWAFRRVARVLDILLVKVWRRRVSTKLGYRVGHFWKPWVKSHSLSC